MAETTKTEVGSYFISNYPPFSQWERDQLDEVIDLLIEKKLTNYS